MTIRTWKRWSWRYRVLALGALMLLLQGSACVSAIPENYPTFNVPGVGEVFALFDPDDNASFVLKEIDPKTGRYIRIHPGDPRYGTIARYYWSRQYPENNIDRSGIPGGAGAPPPPAVQ